MLSWTLDQVAAITGGTVVAGEPTLMVAGVSTDSRALAPGDLFVPLVGEKFDGHDFLDRPADAGGVAGKVAACLTSRREVPSLPAVRVADTLKAYGALARAHRRAWGGAVVAVTGSSGKTSTKEALAALLAPHRRVHRSAANFNNEVGVPRTLLELTPEHEVAVVEMGMRGPGEIAYLAGLAEPDVGVITNVGVAHIGRLGSREAIAKAKGELLHAPGLRTAVVEGDEPLARSTAAHLADDHVLTFGFDAATCAVHAERGHGATFEAFGPAGRRWRVTLGQAGEHHRKNALAALAVAVALGVEVGEEVAIAPPELPGRARHLEAGGVRIVDETYNANPDSMVAALRAFAPEGIRHLHPGRRIAVLGPMGELGEHEEAGHRQVGEALSDLPIDLLITVGDAAPLRVLGQAARQPWEPCPDAGSAVALLATTVRPGDAVFVKGSRSARLERVVDGLVEALRGVRA